MFGKNQRGTPTAHRVNSQYDNEREGERIRMRENMQNLVDVSDDEEW